MSTRDHVLASVLRQDGRSDRELASATGVTPQRINGLRRQLYHALLQGPGEDMTALWARNASPRNRALNAGAVLYE